MFIGGENIWHESKRIFGGRRMAEEIIRGKSVEIGV